ncbi:MAG: Hsp20/alpha crystallin family protein [Bacillota bacterium]|nr:Hsp20/alpha crystallin family protein [Bacillota bacterium]
MDMDKLKKWLELAQGMQGGEFWKSVFDQDFSKQFMNENGNDTFYKGETSFRDDKSEKSFPPIDMYVNPQEVVVVIEIPGIPKDDIELGLSGKVLTVKGIAKSIYPHLQMSYSERFYGEFSRQINLPDVVVPQELSAKFWNGILIIHYNRQEQDIVSIPID